MHAVILREIHFRLFKLQQWKCTLAHDQPVHCCRNNRHSRPLITYQRNYCSSGCSANSRFCSEITRNVTVLRIWESKPITL